MDGVRPQEAVADGSAPEDVGIARPMRATIRDVIARRLARRDVLRGLTAAVVAAAWPGLGTERAAAQPAGGGSTLTFTEIPHGLDDRHHVAPGYAADVLIRWGDPVLAGAPPFDAARLDGAAQARQFGYNNDFLAYMPLPPGSQNSEHGLLCVNHEYTNTELMFAGFTKPHNPPFGLTRGQADVDQAAHGLTVVEVKKTGGRWAVIVGGPYNRRFTTEATAYRLAGPAAGHPRLRTDYDPSGTMVLGTLNNCAGGVTPWGTVLSAEENFNGYFLGDAKKTPEAANHRRYGVEPWQDASWGRHFARFDVERHPHEPNRFGWIVEYDPYDPRSTPVKRTALGRFKHEGATTVVAPDGRVAVYSGDDERWEYVYRFVTAGRFDPNDRRANANLLDQGVLSVARFEADGTVAWLPLIHGQGPLVAANGFQSQADVLIEARRAADLVGATPMDRPEDVEPNPVSGRVYVALTNNDRRKPKDDANARDRADAANPRPGNRWGHVLELIPPGGPGRAADHTAGVYRWEIFLLGGDPGKAEQGARYGAGVTPSGWLAAPDNVAFDPRGRMWIGTDGMPTQAQPPAADALYGVDTAGPGRAVPRRFFAVPRGAELCGPVLTPDGRTLFVAVQHPGEERGSTFDTPSTRWPDFAPGVPPRPAIVVITKQDGGEIGS
jgi:secreted PhoX family phosphatase